MRLVFFSQVHPATPHVSGMRGWYFARELAKQGHQVILICAVRDGAAGSSGRARFAEQLNSHDWTGPLLLAVALRPSSLLRWVRSPRTPSFLRKCLVALSYVLNSGVFTDFTRGAQPYLPIIAGVFRPEATWGVFGNTDSWLIAQRLARLSGCAWVGDMKDPWDGFIPRPLRGLLARRFDDMAAATANALFNMSGLTRWFRPRGTVVYSGADACWLDDALPLEDGSFRITLIGGLYGRLPAFVDGLVAWLARLPLHERSRVVLCYAGAEASQIEALRSVLAKSCQIENHQYLAQADLALLCRRSSANVYFWSPRTFHHKLLELLCARRPIISFPGEYDEARRLAERVGGLLHVCANAMALQRALETIRLDKAPAPDNRHRVREYQWEAQAEKLIDVFQAVIATRKLAA